MICIDRILEAMLEGYAFYPWGKITRNRRNHLLKNRRYMGEYSYRDVVREDGIPAIVPKESVVLRTLDTLPAYSICKRYDRCCNAGAGGRKYAQGGKV